jgi:DNA-binding IclR family transcriptional regulator
MDTFFIAYNMCPPDLVKPSSVSHLDVRTMAERMNDKSDEPSSGISSVRAVDRAIAILQSFTPEQPTMSVLELQRRVGLSRPTLYRLLHTLSARGLVDAIGDPQRFGLAHGVMQLSHVWLKGLDAIEVARPILEKLRDRTGETAALFTLQDDRVVCVLECKSQHVLSISRGVGHAVAITQGATGKAILAFVEADRRAAFLARLRGGEVQRDQLEKTLGLARRNGYAVSHGEIFAGAVAVAAPFFDHQGFVVGSIGLYGPDARLNDDQVSQFARLVVDAGYRISTMLGSRGPLAPNASEKRVAAPSKSRRQNRSVRRSAAR